jgi:enamine deaminase RidA (YjgF/YER057c/UK114 family)
MRMTLLTMLAIVSAPGWSAEPATQWPLRLPAPHGEVILPNEAAKRAHDQYRYAAVRRVDNTLYLSGLIIGRRDGEGRDAAAFRLQVRRGLEQLKATLEAAGAGFKDVVMINTFHVWSSTNFAGTRDEQFAIFEEVIGDFMRSPYPAWTAVGTTGLLSDGGIVEVQLIARLP